MIITILIIIGVVIETILISNTMVTLRMIDNGKECDREFWEDER